MLCNAYSDWTIYDAFLKSYSKTKTQKLYYLIKIIRIIKTWSKWCLSDDLIYSPMKKVYFDDKLGDLLEIVSKRTYKYGITEKYIFFLYWLVWSRRRNDKRWSLTTVKPIFFCFSPSRPHYVPFNLHWVI